MTHPANLLRALPQGGALPENLRDAFIPAGNRPVRIFNALPGSGGVGPQTVLPIAGESFGGWGLIGGGDFASACIVDDGDTTCIQGPDLTPLVGVEFALEPFTDPGPPRTGWIVHVIARKTEAGGGMNADIGGLQARVWTGAIFTGGTPVIGSGADFLWCLVPNGATSTQLEVGYTEKTKALTEAEADLYALTVAPQRNTITFTSRDSGGANFDQVIRITQVYLEIPTGGGGSMFVPANIVNALPATGALVPQNVLDALPT